MATSKKSLAARAGSVVRRAVRGRSGADGDAAATPGATPAAAEKAPAKEAPAKKASATKTPAKKAPAKKTTTKKTATATTVEQQPAAKKAATKNAPAAKKTAAKKTPAKKAPAKKTTAKTAATAAQTTKKAPVTKAPTKKAAAKKAGTAAAALVVREGESPWTEAELEEVREHLRGDIERLGAELQQADTGLHDLMIDSGDGSGQDTADLGSSSFERDHEISIANNARNVFEQSQHALERIADGSYGVCERNEEPIGKLRLMAFPRATLCMTCKQREEAH